MRVRSLFCFALCVISLEENCHSSIDSFARFACIYAGNRVKHALIMFGLLPEPFILPRSTFIQAGQSRLE